MLAGFFYCLNKIAMTAIAAQPGAIARAATATPGEGSAANASKSLRPLPGESQAEFALRFHESMSAAIPETDARNDAMLDAWEAHGNDGGLLQKAMKRFRPEEYKRYRRAPIFAEHTTKQSRKDQYGNSRDEVVVYDRRALAAVADRCNSRIRDTGDFAPLTDGHTPLEIDGGMPDVLGYDGPFRVGMIGNENPRWAIFAEEWHDRDELPRIKKLSRRSPEVWKEERMEDRIIDPVAALGAETPRLDLGTGRYSRPRFGRRADGVLIEKYSATPVPVATGTNTTYVPGGSGDDDKKTDRKDRYEGGGESTMTEQELNAVADKVTQAVLSSEPFQVVSQAAQQLMAEEESAVVGGDGAGGIEMDTAGAVGVGDVTDVSDVSVADAGRDAVDAEVASDEERETDNYMCDDDDKEMMRRYMAGEADNDEMMQYRSGRRKNHYSADGDVEGSEVNKEDGDVADNKVDQYSRNGGKKGQGKVTTANPVTTNVRSRREREEVARYQKLQDRINKLERERNQERQERRKSERYSKLAHLRTNYAFDLKEEANDTAEFSDEQFERHLDRIQNHYQRIPANEVGLFVPEEAHAPAIKSRVGERKEASQDEARRAFEFVDRYRRNNPDKDISFDTALEEVRNSGASGETKTA